MLNLSFVLQERLDLAHHDHAGVAAICSAFLDQKAFSSYLLLSTCLEK